MLNFNVPGIYIIFNSKSNKAYIGSSTRSLSHRLLSMHKRQLIQGKHPNKNLQKDFNRDKKFFKFLVIQRIIKKSIETIEIFSVRVLKAEQYWIDFYDSYDCGYNKAPIAGNSTGVTWSHTNASKLKIREASLKMWRDPNHKQTVKKSHKKEIKNRSVKKELNRRFNIGKANKGKISGRKGKTYEEIHGKEKAKELRLKRQSFRWSKKDKLRISKTRKGKPSPFKGKTYEEIMGVEKANKVKKQRRDWVLQNIHGVDV